MVPQVPRLWREIALPGRAHDGQRLVATAVDDFKEYSAARLLCVFRPEQQKIARKFDLAILVPWREIDVRDAAICGERWIDSEVHAANHTLVRAGIISPADLDADDFGEGGLGCEQQNE